MEIKKYPILFLILLSSFITATAQKDEGIIKVDSSIVRLNVGVADRQGRPIANLNKENFSLFEDGVKQEISHFEATAAPFSVVMLLDMSGSTLGFREVIRQSAIRFIDALAPDDRVAVIEFDDKPTLLNDFTNNRKKILNSIIVANGRKHTQLFKTLDFALEKLSREGNRRKAIIVLTDGVDTGARDTDRYFLEKQKDINNPNIIKAESNDALNKTLNKSDSQGVTIYPLALPSGDPSKLAEPTPIQTALYNASRVRLQILAERTGGTFNAINHLEDMGKIYASVAADLHSLYTIEYSPIDTKRSGNWRTIKIEVNDAELISRTRTGYFAR